MVMLLNRSNSGGPAADIRSPNYLLEKSILNRSNALAQPSPQQSQAASGSKLQLTPEQLETGARLVDVCLRSDRSFNDLRWKLKLQRTGKDLVCFFVVNSMWKYIVILLSL